jgi:uncharacterized protein YodC (DUF2158 family)
MAFQVGDTVKLKSGGPLMTVDHVDGDGQGPEVQVSCVWFDKTTKKQSVFKTGLLASISIPKGGIKISR